MHGICNILLIAALLFLRISGEAQHRPDAAVKSGKTYAVVVGISTYQNKAVKPLQFADKDAGLFAAFLQSDAGGKVPPEQIRLLLNEQATIAAIYDALDWLKENCGENDIAYFYFSGHGDVETKNNFSKGYLLAYNTPGNNYRNNAVRIEDINNSANTLSLTNRSNVILITDACHSGKLAGDFYKGKQLAAAQLQTVLNNEVRLASCAVNEEAAEGTHWDGGRGVFSFYLLRGLQGMAESEKDGVIKLKEISKFLDSSLAADKYLQLDKHPQHPVTDGNPHYPLATIDTATLTALTKPGSTTTNHFTPLDNFNAVGRQPVDYFISLLRSSEMDTVIHFQHYNTLPVAEIPIQVITDCLAFIESIKLLKDSLAKKGQSFDDYDFLNADTLIVLQNQLSRNKALRKNFNEKFVQVVHEKGQDMINAYLSGDIAELEKRQYYYAGNRQYQLYLSQLDLALYLIPKDHNLTNILSIHKSYIGGLINRLEMAMDNNPDSLLALAFANQRQALQMEPYAAYIHNELGNLYMHRKRFDSAEYHFALAVELSPTWAIPWSNRIRLNLAQKKKDRALQAIHIADSLQPNLAYVMLNAGIVMEQSNNLLAAESYYKKAIAQNNVHYLPYERLGYVCLIKGDYEKADKYFYDASLRKDAFAVNDKYFEFGVELGGLSVGNLPTEWEACTASTADNNLLRPYVQLANGLQQLKELVIAEKTDPFHFLQPHLRDTIGQPKPAMDPKEGIQLLQEALSLKADLPFAHHYIGQQLFKEGKWQLAREALEKALSGYQNDSLLRHHLHLELYGNNFQTADTCLLHLLMYYQYDVQEDHYMLGQLYEREKWYDKAIDQYIIISLIENKRQMEQAVFAGFDPKLFADPRKFEQFRNNGGNTEKLIAHYELPINMFGYLKAARLYEQLGEYAKAEQILLSQLAQCRKAGNARQECLDQGRRGPAQTFTGLRLNYYWLNVNRNIEGELYNFYSKVTSLFPRDGEWKQKAGLFLYRRLEMTFRQMPVEERTPYYQSMSRYAYPFLGSEEPAEWGDVRFGIPGTVDTIEIKMPVYDPVKESLDYLQQAVQLSGTLQPGRDIQEALGDLNSWVGNKAATIQLYSELISSDPKNVKLRNKLIDYLLAQNELPAAYTQLRVLYIQKQIKTDQIPLLATFHILSGNYKAAKTVIPSIPVITADEKRKVRALQVMISMVAGNTVAALLYLTRPLPKLLPPAKTDFKNDLAYYEQLDLYEKKRRYYHDFLLYSKARALGLQHKTGEALSALQQALDSGFRYQYVLYNDAAWDKLRDTKKWNDLMAKYEFSTDYSQEDQREFRNPVGYRVPYVFSDEIKERW